MKDYLFIENKENAYDIQKRFSLDDYETSCLLQNFWPIIVLTDISTEEFHKLLEIEKKSFINKRKKNILEIFKRDNLDILIYELNEYLDNINNGKHKIYDVIDNTYFHWFKLKLDTKSYTLLLSKKNEADLEIYFIELLDIIKCFISENEIIPTQIIETKKPELKIDQIALKYAYEGMQITRENGNDIAKKYGHNSGEKLFQRFTYFSSSANRKGKPNLCTPKKLDNKIKLIESIIKLLPTDKQERAKDEVLILKKIYEAEYQ
jgi:hypothetical protein